MFKKVLSLTLGLSFIAVSGFAVAEPGMVGAQSNSDTVNVQLTVDEEISIQDGLGGGDDGTTGGNTTGTVTMSPNLGVTSNVSNGTNTFTVVTNSDAGYTVTLAASTDAAMQSGGNSFTDFDDGLQATAPSDWSVSNDYMFGYSVYGDNTDAAYEDAAVTDCGTSGNPNANLNYNGFHTSPKTVATSASETDTNGEEVTVCYQAEQDTVFAPDGVYTATITATATVQ